MIGLVLAVGTEDHLCNAGGSARALLVFWAVSKNATFRVRAISNQTSMIEDHNIASRISETMLHVTVQLNDSIYPVMEGCSAEEFKRYRRAVGAIMAEILLQVMNPLNARHPDLKPPEME